MTTLVRVVVVDVYLVEIINFMGQFLYGTRWKLEVGIVCFTKGSCTNSLPQQKSVKIGN